MVSPRRNLASLAAFAMSAIVDILYCRVEQWLPVWKQCVAFVLRRSLFLKFRQNPDLRQMLLRTGLHELAAAFKSDSGLGIGFRQHDAREPGNVQRWDTNLLGKTLMEVRACYREKENYRGGFDFEHFEQEMEKHAALVWKKMLLKQW